jgi:hypothetical protein
MNIEKTLLEKVTAALLDGVRETREADDCQFEPDDEQHDISFWPLANADRKNVVADNNRTIPVNQNESAEKLEDSADLMRAINYALSTDTLEIKG